MATLNPIQPQPFSIRDIARALVAGRQAFRAMPGPSVGYATLFVVIGFVLMTVVGVFGVSPLLLPLAGGFMLVGPALLAGFFELYRIYASGGRPRAADALAGFTSAPSGLWAIAGICAFLFLIWITDVSVLYAFMIGAEHLPYELPWLIRLQQDVLAFEFWASVMGSLLAFAIFSISAFSVPLLHEGRAGPIEAISISVRVVFDNLIPALLWGILLSLTTMLAILLVPLLLVVLPVLAYASFALYRMVFPVDLEEGAVETKTMM